MSEMEEANCSKCGDEMLIPVMVENICHKCVVPRPASKPPAAKVEAAEGWEVDAVRIIFPRGESSLWEPDNRVFDSPKMPGVEYHPLIRQSDAQKREVQHIRDLQDIQERADRKLAEQVDNEYVAIEQREALEGKLAEAEARIVWLVKHNDEWESDARELVKERNQSDSRYRALVEGVRQAHRELEKGQPDDAELTIRTLLDREVRG